jgi:hypothetical protein
MLARACTVIDAVAYRPAIVKLTRRLPRWWRCDLARWSMKLDDHWAAGYWSSPTAPAAPLSMCDACGRRAAWLVVGGDADDHVPDTSYLGQHPIYLCGWCRPRLDRAPQNREQLEPALQDARQKSISWRRQVEKRRNCTGRSAA